MTYLLDTNVGIAILRKQHPEIAARYAIADPTEIRTCSVVVGELRYGCLKSANPAANRAAVDALLAPVTSLPYDDAASEHFANVRRYLESLGQILGPYDMQIAAIALAKDCVVVTHNAAEFCRVPGLHIEDWQAAP